MKNIRNNVFETNSSSSHSITISNDKNIIYDTIIPKKGKVIILKGGNFGWDYIKYNDPLTKANYCAVFAKENGSYDLNYEKQLYDVIKEHTGFEVDLEVKGYIDHASNEVALEAFSSKEQLKDFIFNPNSFLITGNDNEAPMPNFYDVGREYNYKYGLVIDGIDFVAKYEELPNSEKIQEDLYIVIENSKSKIVGWSKESDYSIRTFETDINGKNISSFSRMNQGIVLLYALKAVYKTKGHSRGDYLGSEIVGMKEVKFNIVKL